MSGQASRIVLRVTRPEAPDEGVTRSVRLGSGGGVIGRGAQCDMVLPDPGNMVSRRHCEIALRDGRFEVTDLSSNGLYVNGAGAPVGNGRSVALSEGDRLAMGDYEVTVAEILQAEAGAGDAPPDIEKSFSGNPFAPPGESKPAPGEPAARESGDTGNPFGLPDGLESNPFEGEEGDEDWPPAADEPVAPSIGSGSDEAEGPLIPEDYDPLADLGLEPEQEAQPDHAPGWNTPIENVMRSPPRESAPEPDPEPQATPDPEPERQATPEPEGPRPAGSAPTPEAPAAEPHEAMAAFWEAAGVDPQLARNTGPAEAGAMFATMVRGLWEVMRARTAFKEEFRVERTMLGAAENNPLKFAVDAEQALEYLARGQTRGFMAPERAVEEGFEDVRRHEMAMLAAMHRALAHVLEEFDPEALESKLEGMSLLDALPGGRRARYWDLYVKHYGEIAKKAEDIFEGALGREFVQAYERASGTGRREDDE